MLQGEHSATLSTFIKLPFVIKIFVLSIFEWPFYTGFTVYMPTHKMWHLSNKSTVFLVNVHSAVSSTAGPQFCPASSSVSILCMLKQYRLCEDCASAQACLRLRCSHLHKYQNHMCCVFGLSVYLCISKVNLPMCTKTDCSLAFMKAPSLRAAGAR